MTIQLTTAQLIDAMALQSDLAFQAGDYAIAEVTRQVMFALERLENYEDGFVDQY